MASSLANIRQRLQARPIKNFSVSDGGVAASGLSSLNTLPASLRQRYVSAINAAMQKAFGIKLIEIFWDEPAKQAILVHPTFLDKLGNDFGQAIESLPIEVEVVLDERINILYFSTDTLNKSRGESERLNSRGAGPLILTPEQARSQMPPIGTMVEIPEGRYTLGDKAGKEYEKPEHMVEVDPFLIGVFTVTNSEFRKAAESELYEDKRLWTVEGWQEQVHAAEKRKRFSYWEQAIVGGNDRPRVAVTWEESFAYLIWQSLQEGLEIDEFLNNGFFDFDRIYDKRNCKWLWPGYRLPTEHEWEIVARGGLIRKPYPWGDEEPTGERAYFNQPKNTGAVAVNDPRFPASGYGLRHVVGNSWEWCFDLFDVNYYTQLEQMKGVARNPIGPSLGKERVVRGGSWAEKAVSALQVAYRSSLETWMGVIDIGFRAARSLVAS